MSTPLVEPSLSPNMDDRPLADLLTLPVVYVDDDEFDEDLPFDDEDLPDEPEPPVADPLLEDDRHTEVGVDGLPTEVRPEHEHRWSVQAEVFVEARIAKHAAFRQSFRAAADQRIEALEVICHACRRPYDDVAEAECSATFDNTHLRGGPIGERAKRKPLPTLLPGQRVIPGPRINRFGTDGYLSGDSGRM